MNTRDAIALIADAVSENGAQRWADFGAGDGTFTYALVELLGPRSLVYAVDRDATALSSIERAPSATRGHIVPVIADLAQSFKLPELGDGLDGALFANSLHFIPDAANVLARLAKLVKPGGRIVIIEYDRRGPSRWVPYPIPSAELPTLARAAELSPPTVVATRPSRYGGELYVAICRRSLRAPPGAVA